MEVIPAIDLLDGKAVRLRQGRYDEVTVYDQRPEQLASKWRADVAHLHVVDLEGARSGNPVQGAIIERIVDAFGPGVQVGGGIRTRAAIESYFEKGVGRVVLGTAALRDSALLSWAARTYPGQVILAVDARAGKVATHGWLEQSELLAVDLVGRFKDLPLSAVLYTDIERDGTQVGPNVEQTAHLAECGGLPVIASGGVGTLEHLTELSRAHARILAAIVGKALHEQSFSLKEAVAAAHGTAQV